MQLTIGKLAAAGDVGVETIRYYQRRGLMATPVRSGGDGWGGGTRRYDENDLRRLKFIRSAQAAGFSLDEIAGLLALEANDDRAEVRRLARQRIAALDARIAQMTASRAALARLADLCAASKSGPCPILSAFDPACTHEPLVQLKTNRSRSAAGSDGLPMVARSDVEPAATFTKVTCCSR